MPFYACMIQSESTGKQDYGHTFNLDERMESHVIDDESKNTHRINIRNLNYSMGNV